MLLKQNPSRLPGAKPFPVFVLAPCNYSIKFLCTTFKFKDFPAIQPVLDMSSFKGEVDDVIVRARQAGVTMIATIGSGGGEEASPLLV